MFSKLKGRDGAGPGTITSSEHLVMLDYQGNRHKAQETSFNYGHPAAARLQSSWRETRHNGGCPAGKASRGEVCRPTCGLPALTQPFLLRVGGSWCPGVPVHQTSLLCQILVVGGGRGRAKKTIPQDELQNKGEGATQVK